MDDILEEIKETRNLVKIAKRNSKKLAEQVREICIYFLGSDDYMEIESFTITYKHPWYLRKNKFKKELEIRRHGDVILNWIEYNTEEYFRYEEWKWDLVYFNMKHNNDLKDLLFEIQAILDIDLLEVKLDNDTF